MIAICDRSRHNLFGPEGSGGVGPEDQGWKSGPSLGHMGARREEVDLWLVLTDPQCARQYIKKFEWQLHFEEAPRAITTKQGRYINLACMSDQEAVVLALELLREYEMEIVISEFRRAEALNEVC